MALSKHAKRERLEARVPAAIKALLQQAADLNGLSLSDFVIISAKEAAEKTIQAHKVIALTERDSLLFAEALLTPADPNAKLRAALERYEAEVAATD